MSHSSAWNVDSGLIVLCVRGQSRFSCVEDRVALHVGMQAGRLCGASWIRSVVVSTMQPHMLNSFAAPFSCLNCLLQVCFEWLELIHQIYREAFIIILSILF